MAGYPRHVFSPGDVFNPPDGGIRTWDSFPTRHLAQGDSRFSFGTLLPWDSSAILQQMSRLKMLRGRCGSSCMLLPARFPYIRRLPQPSCP
ncbi:MAG: hypothetical protein PHY45_05310 [Rhodocyclaceae bacterium]|nr:hypothetical protein [Rhodocyclaceae bacterium]